MSKKKKSKKKSSEKIPPKKKGAASFRIVSIILGIMAIVAIVFFATRPQAEKRIPGQLLETRPVLPANRFSGKIARAYQYAEEIPEIIDLQFCYCYCKKNFGHKTLLTCFTNDHGSMCDVCMNEVFRSYELHKKGVSKEEIKKAIDAEFWKPRNS